PVHHTGASTPLAKTSSNTASPITSVGWRRSKRPLVPNAWIEDDVEDIHDEVDQDVDAGDDEQHALDHRVVAPHDGIDGEAAQPGQREDALGYHGAADEEREADREDGHERQRGARDRVAHQHSA